MDYNLTAKKGKAPKYSEYLTTNNIFIAINVLGIHQHCCKYNKNNSYFKLILGNYQNLLYFLKWHSEDVAFRLQLETLFDIPIEFLCRF